MDSSVLELQKFVQASHVLKEKNLTISDLGRLDHGYLKESMGTYDAAKLLSKNSRTGLPVLNEQNKVIGFLSEKDCLKDLYEKKLFQVEQGKVTDLMIRNVLCLEEGASIYHTIDMFIKYPVHVFPVIDSTGGYVGLVKRSDVFKFLL